MAGLRLYAGNRLEILAGRLAERISHPLPSPLHSEVIIMQSRGIQRWLSMELARHHDICANIRFPFPNAFLDEIFSAVVPEYEKKADDNPEVMAWRIMALLPSQSQNRTFETIRSYLNNGHDDIAIISAFQAHCRSF